MADLNLTAGLDTSDADKGFRNLQQSLAQLSQQVQSQSGMMTGTFDSLKSKGLEALGALGIATGLKSFATQVATVRGEFQQLESAFTTLLGSETKASSLMEQLTHTAAITPFGLQDVASAAKQLLAYGTAADEVNDKIMQLGNIAAGLNLNMGYMSMLYGTTATKDFMDTMDLKQHKSQGIAIDEEIAKVMGVDKNEVANLVTNRQVTSAIYKQAIANLAGNGGKFDGMMENQSKTITGQISNIEDAVTMMFNEIGKSTEGVISSVLSGAQWVVENYEKVATAIGTVVAAYGSYKAALVTMAAINKSYANAEIESLQKILGIKEEDTTAVDARIKKLVEEGQITQEQAQKILELREEVQKKIEAENEEIRTQQEKIAGYDEETKRQNSIIKNAKDNMAAAKETAAANKEQLQATQARAAKLEESINAQKEEVEAAQKAWDAIKDVEAEKEKAAEAQGLQFVEPEELTRLNEAKNKLADLNAVYETNAKQQQKLAEAIEANVNEQMDMADVIANANDTKKNIRSDKKSAKDALTEAETRAQTLAMELNTAATHKNNAAKQAASLIGKQVTQVWKGLTTAIKANPLGFIASGVIMLIGLIKEFATYQTDWEKAQDGINQSMNKGIASAAGEIAKLQSLNERVKESKEALDKAKEAQEGHAQSADKNSKAVGDEEKATTDASDAQAEYNRVKMEVISQFGEYHKGLENEYDALVKNNSLYETLTTNIMEYHMRKAKADASDKAVETYQESVGEQFDDTDEIIKKYKGQALRSADRKVESGKMTAEERKQLETDWTAAEKEIKRAIMNGTLSYSFEKGLQVLKKTGVDANGNDVFEDTLSARTKELTEARDAVTGVETNIFAKVGTNVAKQAKLLQDSLNDIEDKYEYAFESNGLKAPTSSSASGVADGIVKEGDYNSEWLKKKTEQIKQAEEEYNQAVKDLKAGKRYQPLGTTDEADMKDIDNEYVAGKKAAWDKALKEYQEGTGESFYAGKNRVKLVKGGGEKTVDAMATRKEREQLSREMEEAERKAGEAAINAIRQRMLDEEQAEINLMDNSYAKRIAQRNLDNKKEILAIYAEAEQQKEAVIEAAKQRFDAEESMREKSANLKGLYYEKKTFDRQAFIDSQIDEEGMGERSDFYIIDQAAAKKYDTTIKAQGKAQDDQWQQDLASYKEFWTNILKINQDYIAQTQELDKQVEAGTLTQGQADTMRQAAKMNYDDEMAKAGADGSLNGIGAQQTEADIAALAQAALTKDMETLNSMLRDALTAIDGMTDGDKKAEPETVAVLKAKVEALQARIKELQSQKNSNVGDAKGIKSTIKVWKSWGDTVSQTGNVFSELGDSISGAFGDALNIVGEITQGTTDVINSLVSFADTSMTTVQTTSETTSEAIQTVEKATVILAIIEAAIKLFNLVDGFLNSDDSREVWQAAVDKQAAVNKMTDAVNDYRTAVIKAQQEEESWFSSTGFDNITNSIETAQDAMEKYNNKVNQQQVEYQNEKGGRSFLQRLGRVFVATGLGVTGTAAMIKNKQDEKSNVSTNMVNAIDNLRFETQSAKKGKFFKKGRDQKTVDLRTWAKQTYGTDLFDEDGMIDTEMAENIIENYGDKLVGETKATLQALIDDAEAYKEAMDSLKETVSEWYSPLVDNMTDALLNWLDTGEDVLTTFEDSAGETFRSIAQQMVKTLIQSTVYDGFSDKVQALAEQYGKGEITMDEMYAKSLEYTETAMQTAEEAMPQLKNCMEKIDELGKQYGIDISGDAEEQQATYGGYETMSEETGTELSGRFSAMYIVQSQHLALAQGMAEKMETSLNVLAMNNSIVNDIRTLHSQSNNLLTSLLKVTSNMYGNWSERIEHIEKYTKNMQ